MAQVVETEYTPELYAERFRAAHALIAPYVIGDDGELPGHTFLSGSEAFERGLEELIAHANARQGEVRAYLDGLDNPTK